MRKIILLLIISGLLPSLKGQAKLDSVEYWVNEAYLSCINSGFGVCSCQEKYDYLIVDFNPIKNEIIIIPSIYYSWETLTGEMIPNKTNIYPIKLAYGIDSGTTVIREIDKLIINRKNKSVEFIKMKFNKMDDDPQWNMYSQLGLLNGKPLLTLNPQNCDNQSNLIITRDSLENLINLGKVWVSCSDDYHYDILDIGDPKTQFFMVYKPDRIVIYPIPLRDRFQKIDISTIKECQYFEIK